MTKLEMAHELLITLIQAGEHNNCSGSAVKYVWEVIDAMQAEADKRSDMERPTVLQDEWQPDWSVAPEWANWFAIDGNGDAYWYELEPKLNATSSDFREYDGKTDYATLFSHQGSWENSLCKRP